MKSRPSRSDIFIFGGGISGICAALSAAREGAVVHLADPRKQLGGSVGEDLQTPMDFSSSCNNPFFRESGIFEEIITALRCENKEGTFTGQARTLLSIVSKETNLTIKLGYNLLEVSPNSSKDRIEACTIIDHDNCAKYLHRAEYFIDCSETGELAKMANAPGEDRSPINPDLKKSANPLWSSSVLIEIDTAPEETPFQCPDWVSRKWEDNSVSARLSFMESLEKQLGGYHLLEWIGEGHQCPDANELCWTAWDYIKNRSPLKEAALDLFVKRIIPLKNPRFVFRGTGDYQITQEDLLKGNTFKDSVAVGRCPIQKDGTLSFSPREKFVLPDSFEIPLRSLYSQKIKNLLWAGPHASCEEIVSASFTHPPTLSQMGSAAGHCAARCIFEKRLPRTLAKSGHIEVIRKKLAKNNHRTGKDCDKDDGNLTSLAEVSASSTWQMKNFLELPLQSGVKTSACLVQFPVTSGHIESVRLLIDCTEAQTIDVRLLAGSTENSHIPGSCLGTASVTLENPGEQWVTFDLDAGIQKKSWHFLEILSNHNFRMIEGRNAPVGYLLQYPREIFDLALENPYSEYCPRPSLSPQPHRCAIMEVTPPQKTYEANQITSWTSRPDTLPGLWISQPTNFAYPEFVEFNWPSPVTISRLDLFFDPCFGYHTSEKPLSIKMEKALSLVREYRLYFTSEDGKTNLLEEITNNDSAHRVHTFEMHRVRSMEIEIVSTHGLDRAQIFRVAAYD